MERTITRSKNGKVDGNGKLENRVAEILMPESKEMSESSSIATELALLRRNYINRIGGMVKAIAAVERNRDKSMAAVNYVSKLNEMNAEELIEEYRIVSAKFRSAFPSSFGPGSLESRKMGWLKNPEVYK